MIMRKAPNWVRGEAVNGIWKQDLLKYLGEYFNLKTLIETGTCEGGTLSGIFDNFDDIHTIELSDYYYELMTKGHLSGYPHIHFYHGNSDVMLRKILEKIPYTPTLFWLDAHPSGGKTANAGDPLPDEIKAIMELRPDGLIVIDDQCDDLLQNCVENGINFTGWIKEFRYGVVFLHKGNYDIPEFKD